MPRSSARLKLRIPVIVRRNLYDVRPRVGGDRPRDLVEFVFHEAGRHHRYAALWFDYIQCRRRVGIVLPRHGERRRVDEHRWPELEVAHERRSLIIAVLRNGPERPRQVLVRVIETIPVRRRELAGSAVLLPERKNDGTLARRFV